MKIKRKLYKFFEFFEESGIAFAGIIFGLFIFAIMGFITSEIAHPSYVFLGEKTSNEIVLDNIGMIFHNFLTSWISLIFLIIIASIIAEVYLNVMKIDLSDYKNDGIIIKLGYVAYRKIGAIIATMICFVAAFGWIMIISFLVGLIWIILVGMSAYWYYILIGAVLIFGWLYINYKTAGEE